MNTNDTMTTAIDLLAGLGGEVVSGCPVADCEICLPVLDLAA